MGYEAKSGPSVENDTPSTTQQLAAGLMAEVARQMIGGDPDELAALSPGSVVGECEEPTYTGDFQSDGGGGHLIARRGTAGDTA
jgi:hypothetical protein